MDIKKSILENVNSICYTRSRQNEINNWQKTTKTPRGANSWGFLFRFCREV